MTDWRWLLALCLGVAVRCDADVTSWRADSGCPSRMSPRRSRALNRPASSALIAVPGSRADTPVSVQWARLAVVLIRSSDTDVPFHLSPAGYCCWWTACLCVPMQSHLATVWNNCEWTVPAVGRTTYKLYHRNIMTLRPNYQTVEMSRNEVII